MHEERIERRQTSGVGSGNRGKVEELLQTAE